jgi:hypothetical protein
MTEVRDHQRARVYAWEERFVAPRDPSSVVFAQAQGMVDAIWAELVLRFPPKVVRLPHQARTTIADATRLLIRLADPTPSWCLLHELAHAMSSTHEGESDGHGPRFMGLYAQLLIRYLRVPADVLCNSLHDANINVDMNARPVFLDDRPTRRAAVSAVGPHRPILRAVTT